MVEIKKEEDETVVTPTAENTNVQQVFGTNEIKAPPVVEQPVVTKSTAPIVQPIVENPKILSETQNPNIESYKAQDGTIQTRATTGRDGITPMVNTIPEIKPKTTKIEQPKVSTPITKETNWADIEKKDLNSLEQLVEARYGIVATQKDGKLVGNIGGKDYAWGLNNEGNPEKTEVVKGGGEQLKQKLLNKYITASKDDLYKSLINGDIPQEIQSQLQLNPNFSEAKQKYDNKKSTDSLNSQMKNVFGVIKGEDVKEESGEEESLFKKISKSIFDGKGEEEVITKKKFMSDNYPELVKDVEDLNAKIKTKKELEETSRNTLKDIIKNNPGITKGAAILLANKQNEAINEEYRKISDDITELGANIRYKTDIADADFNILKQEQEVEKQRQYNEKMLNEQRAYNQLLTEDERAYNQSLTEDERKYQEQKRTTELEQEYAYTYGDLNSENPTLQNIAIERAVGDLYTKYPLPGMESQSAKVAKVKERMAMGMTGSEALSTVESEIRSSQRFNELANPPKKSEYTEFGGNLYKIDSDGNIGLAISGPKQYSKLDDGTYQDNEGNIITKQEMDASNQSFDYNGLNKTSVLSEKNNVQCGKLVNTFIEDKTGNYGGMGDKYETKVNTINNIGKSSVPQVGGVFAFPYTSKDIGYNTGHTGIVTKVNQDGSIEVMEANIEGSKNGGAVREGIYSSQSVKNMIFSKSLQNGGTQGGNAPLEYESQILNFVPKNQLDSPKEKNDIKQKIGELYNKGLSPEDAVLVYKGFDLKNKELAQKYLNIGTNLGDDLPNSFYGQVSNLLNKGDISGAEKYVSNIIEDKAKKRYGSDFVSTAGMNKMTEEFGEIRTLIDKNRDKIGAVDGRLDNLYKKYGDIGEIQRLRTLMTGSLAELRKNFAGSAVTETELKALADYISAGVIDNPDNLIEQFTTIRDMTKNTFLSQRKQFGYTPLGRDAKGNLKSQPTENDPLGILSNTVNNDPLGLLK